MISRREAMAGAARWDHLQVQDLSTNKAAPMRKNCEFGSFPELTIFAGTKIAGAGGDSLANGTAMRTMVERVYEFLVLKLKPPGDMSMQETMSSPNASLRMQAK